MPSSMRSVLLMRLAVYGAVVLLAAAALAVRAAGEPDEKKESWGALYHGQTPEGLLAALSVTDGKVHQAYLRWRMTCEKDRPPAISTITFKPEYGDRFRHDGRRFSAGGRKEEDVGGGERIRYDVRVSGQMSEDGMTASGSGQTTETWLRDGSVVDVCRSERVPWTVHRGMTIRD